MKVYMRDEEDGYGHEIADVDPREVEAVFNTVRFQRVYNQDTGDSVQEYTWQFVYGEEGAYAEIILHRGTDT